MAERYLLKADWQNDWADVSRKDWIHAERRAGFRPKMSSDDPRYMDVCATGGFSNGSTNGRIEHVGDPGS